MQSPSNLRVTSQALEVAKATYLATSHFDDAERLGLVSQMRRAAISIGSNISEGCGRGENSAARPFLQYALGSVNELAFQLAVARALSLGREQELLDVETKLGACRGMLIRLLQRMRRPAPAIA